MPLADFDDYIKITVFVNDINLNLLLNHCGGDLGFYLGKVNIVG